MSVLMLQLLCLPLPLMPANGFSWNRQARPYLSAVLLDHLHRQVLVIGGQVGVLEDRGDLVLAGGDLVVAGLDRDAELEQLVLGVGHAGQHAGRGSLPKYWSSSSCPLGGRGAEQGAAGGDQVGPEVVEVLVDQEVFLLRPDGREHVPGRGVAEQFEDAQRLAAEGFHRPQQRGLGVQGLAGPAEEGGGDDQGGAVGVLDDVGGAGRVPGGVAAGLEGGAEAAAGEAAGVGLALDQLAAAELEQGRPAAAGGGQEAVVLLGRDAGQRLEDVGEVGRPVLHGPVLHGRGDGVADARVQRQPLADRLLQRLEDGLGQAGLGDLLAEDVGPELVLDVDGLEVDVVELVNGDRDRLQRVAACGSHGAGPQWLVYGGRVPARPGQAGRGRGGRVSENNGGCQTQSRPRHGVTGGPAARSP